MSLVIATLPILLTILAGYAVAASGILPRESWDPINTISFRLLIPVVLVRSIATSDLSGTTSAGWMLALLVTVGLAALFVLALRPLISRERLPDPSFTTLFQTTTRWNAFIALAAAEQFMGAGGLAMLAVGMAVLIPVINILNIVVLVAYGTARTSLAAILRATLGNPLVQGCLIGLAINFSGGRASRAGPCHARPDRPGGARHRAPCGRRRHRHRPAFRHGAKHLLGVVLRLVLCPAIFLATAGVLGLGLQETLAGSLVFAVPAAANGYVIARKMGGDADLYADILTWQTVGSMALLPVLAAIVGALF